MTEDEARQVELVRAIETEDADAALLTREDREQADAHARAVTGVPAGRADEARFIAARAGFATTRLATRHPPVAALSDPHDWARWLWWLVPFAALIAGFVANELGSGRRLDLLAVPLLGTIAWNLLVYAALPFRGLGRRALPARPRFTRLGQHAAGDTPLARGLRTFRLGWAARSAPLIAARTGRTLHLGAALFALGLIGGIYLRALVIEYRAGWESTFLGPEAVHAILSFVLGPASLMTGVAIPPVSEIAAMRWTGPTTGGVNAGPWIHLYTVTLVGLVVVPRLLLAAWQASRAWRFARHFPMPGREDFYVRRILRAGGGRSGAVRITPYAYRPDEATQRRLEVALRAAFGDAAQVRFDAPVDYGAEETWLAAHAADPGDDHHILLFNLSATPEAENHGALATGLARRIASEATGTHLSALIDEAPYRAHFAGQPGLDERIAGRLSAWRRVLADAGVPPVALDLSRPADAALVERLESGLMSDAAMRA